MHFGDEGMPRRFYHRGRDVGDADMRWCMNLKHQPTTPSSDGAAVCISHAGVLGDVIAN